jgi:nicotinamidase-related amidase
VLVYDGPKLIYAAWARSGRPCTVTPMKPFGRDAVLLVIDMQRGFDEAVWGRRNNPHLEERVAEVLHAWRSTGRPVFHAKHMSTSPTSPLRPGQAGNDFKSFAEPRASEPVFEKRVNSSFIGTSLEADLRRRGYETLVIAGLTTNHCVSTTTRMAGNLGFATWLASDATAAFDRVGPDGAHYEAELVHSIALSDLHGEFATVVDTKQLLASARHAHV